MYIGLLAAAFIGGMLAAGAFVALGCVLEKLQNDRLLKAMRRREFNNAVERTRGRILEMEASRYGEDINGAKAEDFCTGRRAGY